MYAIRMPKSKSKVITKYCAINGAGNKTSLVITDWKLKPEPRFSGGNESIIMDIKAGP